MRTALLNTALLLLLLSGMYTVIPAYESARTNMKAVEMKGLTLPPLIVKLMAME